MEPILLSPSFKDYLWGGTRLKELYDKKTDLEIVAESWELSTHPDGLCTVRSGPDQGITLSAYLEKHGSSLLGRRAAEFDYFPLLIKLIDAKSPLSVQVHPDDTYALATEGEYGKTEMWYIMDAEEDAFLYYGLNTTVTREEFRRHLADKTVTEILNRVPVHQGDVFFIPAGTIHAIGAGILICEIQQNSNTTYRVYDYDRRDAQGNLRPLHIDKALAVSHLGPPPPPSTKETPKAMDGYTMEVLANCPYFTTEKFVISDRAICHSTTESFHALVITKGEGQLTMGDTILSLHRGDCVLIPAADIPYTLAGSMEVIRTHL